MQAIEEPEYYIHLQPHSALLVERKSMYYFRLSGEAVEIALLLAKNKSVAKTAQVLSIMKKETISEQDLTDQLAAHPITEAWIHKVPSFVVTGSTRSYLPISCTLQLTNGCNLFCSFCYSSSGRRLKGELKAEDWIAIMHRLAANGINDITLTGGEARLIKGFKEIVTTASSLFSTVNLFSNGLNWKDDEVNLISNLANLSVQISIDGSPKIHDQLRGKEGAFVESINTIEKLSNHGVPTLVAMTVNPNNYQTVAEVIEYCVNAGASGFRAGMTLPLGRAEQLDTLSLSQEQYQDVQAQFFEANKKYQDQIYLQVWDGKNNEGCTEYSTPGYLQWYIRADGLVTPCQIETEALGHILEDSFETLGRPANLQALQQRARTCRCLAKVNFPDEVDLPHSFA
ncbi:sporulation killing factor system radical SAM maturase [Amphibacillus cookii]|uniref:sporulation killing factor system radical SAM maturase n=1 Tax=Amphibacillus cookii TaxID=767787 RepID=UPI001EF88657|nr:sporulation killing factor system radical SAM maturase [Amphibacillus cookii]MBM7541074.1 sporulation killing factor system radical SAM maturase [Amphibacillus cookii]